jgi:hypothetical protein
MGVGGYGQVKNRRRRKEEDKMKERSWFEKKIIIIIIIIKVEEELLPPFSFFNHLLHLGYPVICMFLAKTTRLDYLPSMRIL